MAYRTFKLIEHFQEIGLFEFELPLTDLVPKGGEIINLIENDGSVTQIRITESSRVHGMVPLPRAAVKGRITGRFPVDSEWIK